MKNANVNIKSDSGQTHENTINYKDCNTTNTVDTLPGNNNINSINRGSNPTNNEKVDALVDCIVGLAASGEVEVAIELCTSFQWSSIQKKAHKRSV